MGLIGTNIEQISGNEELRSNLTQIYKENVCKHALLLMQSLEPPPPCEVELLNSGLENALMFVAQKIGVYARRVGKDSAQDIFASTEFMEADWISISGLYALEFMEKMLTDQYIIEVRSEQSRTKNLGWISFVFWIITMWLVSELYFFAINRKYQRTKHSLLLIPDQLIISNEAIMT